jgi:hypothetical protein
MNSLYEGTSIGIWQVNLLNFSNVLSVIIPILLSVAFMTIIERKILAAMQRRLGPTDVGADSIINKDNCKLSIPYFTNLPCTYVNKGSLRGVGVNSVAQSKRYLHSNIFNKTDIINVLYKDRIDYSLLSFDSSTGNKWKLFDSVVLDTLYNIASTEEKNKFLSKYKDKGGIYLFQYIDDSSVYYIGRTKNFKKRLNTHLKKKFTDKFHLFANLVSWNKFNFSIIEICDLNLQKERENYYLKKYLPLLNTVFKSKFRESQIYDTLYTQLKARQAYFTHTKKYSGISVYLYTIVAPANAEVKEISKNFRKYDSINTLSEEMKVSRFTIKRYLNTNVPYKNQLFLTEPIIDFNLTYDLMLSAKKGLNLNSTDPKKVIAYLVNDKILTAQIFKSKEAAARFLNVQTITITNHINNWIKGGINGYYLFSKELNNLEKEKLIKISNLRKTNNFEVWVYDANKLESIYGTFNSIKKAADQFNLDYRTILKHLDTNKATIKNDKLVFFFSKKLTLEEIKKLKLNSIKPYFKKGETLRLWVYKKINSEFILINNNEPTFTSKELASKELKMSPKTITKYLDTNNSYKDLFFYSQKF